MWIEFNLLINRLRFINELAKILLLSISRYILYFEWWNLNIWNLKVKACSIFVICNAVRRLMDSLFNWGHEGALFNKIKLKRLAHWLKVRGIEVIWLAYEVRLSWCHYRAASLQLIWDVRVERAMNINVRL